MDSASAQAEDIKFLEDKLTGIKLPSDLYKKNKAYIERLVRLISSPSYSQEFDAITRYLDWIITIPWEKESRDILSIENAKKIMDANHYGLESIKEKILEYIAVLNLKREKGEKVKAPAMLFLGLVGTGKTTMAYSVAQALGRKFGRIPMGGMGDAIQLRGRSRAYPDAEPGQIMKLLRRTQTKNPVILLDEIDRVTDEARADIMGVLVEILDPEQNSHFLDHFIDYPFDLSQVFFIATANNTKNIATAVLDRLEIIEMPSYTDNEKITIAKNYLVQKAFATSGLSTQDITFDESVWEQIVRPLGFDAGMRTLDRTINSICRKVAKLKLEGRKEKVLITPANLKEFTST